MIGDRIDVCPAIADGNAFSISSALILLHASKILVSQMFCLFIGTFVASCGNKITPGMNSTIILPGTILICAIVV